MLEFHGTARENGENSRKKLQNVVADSTVNIIGVSTKSVFVRHCGFLGR